MKIKRIAHIGVGVKDTDQSAKLFTEMLDLNLDRQETLGELKISFIPVGETNLELVQSTEPDGVMAKFVEKKGEGIHHMALEVDDLDAALEELKARGVRLIDETAKVGAHGARIAFIHPKAAGGILLELCEYPKGR